MPARGETEETLSWKIHLQRWLTLIVLCSSLFIFIVLICMHFSNRGSLATTDVNDLIGFYCIHWWLVNINLHHIADNVRYFEDPYPPNVNASAHIYKKEYVRCYKVNTMTGVVSIFLAAVLNMVSLWKQVVVIVNWQYLKPLLLTVKDLGPGACSCQIV